MDYPKQACMEMCMQSLQQYHEEGDFLARHLSQAMKCVHHYEPKQISKHGVETHVIAQDQGIDVDTILGLRQAHP
jgi:hypothetical protein